MTDRQIEAWTEVVSSDDLLIDAETVSKVLGVNPQSVRDACHEKTVGFNAVVVGNKVFIPRKPFIQYLGGKDV